MKKFFLSIIISAVTISVMAQFSETIRTGRPGQAIGPFSVGSHVYQTQTGFDLGAFSDDPAAGEGSYLAPNTVLRFGITDKFEINTGWEYRKDNYNPEGSSYSTRGLSFSSIGTRINLFEGRGAIPAIGLQVTFKMPVLSPDYNPQYLAPKIVLAASEKISERCSFLINIGTNYSGNDPEPSGEYVANFSYSLTDKWGTFIENYGNFGKGSFENRWDTGLAYLYSNNLQFDIYGGAGKNNGRLDYFASIGISWRLVTNKNRT